MKRSVVVTRNIILVLGACLFLACGNRTVMNAYVFNDANVAGDVAKGIKPVRNLIVWPLTNNAAGTKSKGAEAKLYDVFVDKFYLEGAFDSVIIVSPDRAADLLVRASEELGLKRKPKDLDSGLVATKVGQLTGGEAIFTGTLTDYDEEKTDKITESSVSATFFIIDAREKAYQTLDSFTALKYLWRATVKQISGETIVAGRSSLDAVARDMIDKVVANVVSSISSTAQEERKGLDRKIGDLRAKAEDFSGNEEHDKAIAVYNDILKLDPGSADAKSRIEALNARKKEAEERKKAEALKKEIDALKKDAAALEKDGKLEEALAKWTAITEKDKANAEAAERIQKLKARVAEEKERAKQQEISKQLYLAQKNFDEKKYAEAADVAKKILEADPKNEKAGAILSDASAKLDANKAKEKEEKQKAEESKKVEESKKPEPESAPAEQAPAAKPAPAVEPQPETAAPAKPAPAPAAVQAPAAPATAAPAASGSPEVEELRKSALAAFDKEDYQKSYNDWKKLLELAPNDSQGKEMLDTTEMLMKALQ